MHAYERHQHGNAHKSNLPESSEVVALIARGKYRKMDVPLRSHGEIDKNGNKKLYFIHLGHRIHDPLLFH